jgi:hypothetical protein
VIYISVMYFCHVFLSCCVCVRKRCCTTINLRVCVRFWRDACVQGPSHPSRRAACHWAWRDLLPVFGAIADDGRIVRDGNILSGGGVTAGIDFVLALIAELRGQRVAETVQLGLEYAPQPPFNSGRPDTAPADVLAAVNARRRAAAQASRRTRRCARLGPVRAHHA